MCSINNKYINFVQNVTFKWSNKYKERDNITINNVNYGYSIES